MAILLIALPLIAALTWVGAIVVDPGPYEAGAALLIGLGLLTGATVSTVGMALTGGRWARRMATIAMAGSLLLALARPVDPWWWAGVVATVVAVVGINSGASAELARKLPSATGPPGRAVALVVALLLVPLALGLGSWLGSNAFTVTVGVSAPIAAMWYSRVLPGGYYVARYGWPAVAVVLAPFQPLWASVVSASVGIVIAVIAADSSVRIAFYPPVEQGTAVPIPPELTPPDVLAEADLDERGRRRR
jgi:hypothetical protein